MADIYIVDRLNAVIRKVDAVTGFVTTAAGTRGTRIQVAMEGLGRSRSCVSSNDLLLSRWSRGLLIADVQDRAHPSPGCPQRDHHHLCWHGGEGLHGRWPVGRSSQHTGERVPYDTDRRGSDLHLRAKKAIGIRRVDTNGIMSTYAGTGERGYGGDGGLALVATWGKLPKAIRCDTTTTTCWWWTPKTTRSATLTW